MPLLFLVEYAYILNQLKKGDIPGGKADNLAYILYSASSSQSMKKKPELVLENRVGSKLYFQCPVFTHGQSACQSVPLHYLSVLCSISLDLLQSIARGHCRFSTVKECCFALCNESTPVLQFFQII